MPSRWRRLLELLALCGLVVAEPVLTAFRDGADVFVSRRAEAMHVVGFTLVVVLALPLLLWGIEALVGLYGPTAQDRFHRGVLGLLAALLVLRVLIDAPWVVKDLAALAAAVGLYLAAGRWDGVRQWLQLLA